MIVRESGEIQWGDGTSNPATDTRLFRYGAGVLKTGADFYAGSGVDLLGNAGWTRLHGAQPKLFFEDSDATTRPIITSQPAANTFGPSVRVNADGQIKWSSGAADYDTNLYRSGVGELTITGMLKVTGAPVDPTDVATVQYVTDNSGGVALGDNNVWTGTNQFNLGIVVDDAQAVAFSDVSITRRAGGKIGTELTLFGGSGLLLEGVLDTDHNVHLNDNNTIVSQFTSTLVNIIETHKTGQAEDRFYLGQTGKMEFGGGVDPLDTNMYRSGPDLLKTDDRFQAVDGITTKVFAGTPTDGDFAQTPTDGTMVADTTASKLWIRFGGVWKAVTLA